METSQVSYTPDGWKKEIVFVVGARERVGGEYFCLGRNPHIRTFDWAEEEGPAILVANEFGDVALWSNLFDTPREHKLQIRGDAGPDDWYSLSKSGAPTPDNFSYTATLPNGDLIVCRAHSKKAALARRLNLPGKVLCYDWPRPWGNFCGVPEAIHWRRDGSVDLLLGTFDGKLFRLPHTGTDKPCGVAEEVIAGERPLQQHGRIAPCVVDWNCKGKQDLLIGDGRGVVHFFRDVGDEMQVRFNRGRRLVTADGLLQVEGAASPTVLSHKGQRFLIVADGFGLLWRWPIEEVESLVTTNVAELANVTRRTHAMGEWYQREYSVSSLLCAGPLEPVSKPPSRDVATVYEPPARDLTISLPATGLYEIHLTLVQAQEDWPEPQIVARLEGEADSEILCGGEFHRNAIQEIFFKTANLTGQSLQLRQLAGAIEQEGGLPVTIAGVRLVPVRQIESTLAAEARELNVAAVLDTLSWTRRYRSETANEIAELISWHQSAGFDLIYFKIGGGAWEYSSLVPGAQTVVPDLPNYSEADRHYNARLKEMWEGVNRISLAIESCHKHGLKFFAWMRLQNHGEHISARFPLDRFYLEHPEYLEKDREGDPVAGKLCLGFPEVRRFHIEILREVLAMGADGVLIETLRHLPKVMFGDPVVAEFRERHGLDMRTLSPFDPRVVKMQVDIMTRFLREAREAIRSINPHAELHVRVCKPYPLMGVDPGLWAREGLVDAVIIEDRSPVPADPDIEGLVEVLRNTSCAAGACFARSYWRDEIMPLHPDLVEERVTAYRDTGAQILAFYETAEVIARPELRRAIRRLKLSREYPSKLN